MADQQTDAPFIVLVHGFMQNAHTWDEVRALLPADLRVAAPTLDPVDSDYATLEGLADKLRKSILPTGSAVFVGYSMGGRILQTYARRYPETVKALVLESAGLGPETEDDRARYAQRNERWAQRFEKADTMSQVVDWWQNLPLFSTQRHLSASVQEKSRSMRLACDPKHLAWLTERAGVHTMPLAPKARAMLCTFPFPVHYFYGACDSKYSRTAQTLDSSNIQLHAFDAGHNVHMEQPEAFAEQLLLVVRQAYSAN